ncbi:hypothetical protein J2R98_001890 [Alkalibacillus filiformis]|uniref:Transposase n=1 Tax=Alkalibacillus filiformis TaxID=200990 RepID=A0ABU0DUC1_9BACI|nr:hypothetical protein [Alkalibacillus filiformis]
MLEPMIKEAIIKDLQTKYIQTPKYNYKKRTY